MASQPRSTSEGLAELVGRLRRIAFRHRVGLLCGSGRVPLASIELG